MWISTYPSTLFILELFLFLYLQGLNLLELASHLEEKAAQLHHEGLEMIKMALAGTDTSSLLKILEGSFGHVDLDISVSSALTKKPAKKSIMAEKISEVPEKTAVPPLMMVVYHLQSLYFP